ncbi:MAG: hypothetical protein HY608_10065, partial [Planctomycetes bacterium]|nr:hypothetical protein [Planctomycetota bacterium]
MTRGIVLILVSGLLSVLAILAALFVRVGSVRTQISRQYVESARARLLACSGMEYASARLKADPSVPGVRTAANQPDDWTYRDDPSVLLAWALNPSYRHRRMEPYTDLAVGGILNGRYDAGSDAYVDLDGNGQADGFSGRLRGTGQRLGDVFSLRIEDANTRIHVNGGRLDAALSPVGTPYHKDTAPGGPNGWLVRLLNNLDAAVTGAAPGTLGGQVVGVRPAGGYATADALRTVIGDARYAMFERYLTLHAWVDPKVARPQPMDGRPNRFLDVDDRHRGGANSPATISGLPVVGGVAGSGTEASPWTQTVQYSNDWEGAHNYPLPWERNFVYAWRQLRLGDADLLEPRAPVNVNGASREALSAVLLGLRGVHLDVWEGTGGWDGGFGWYNTSWEEPVQPTPALEATYVYPSEATEQAPWHRSRADHGSGYGVPGRPWYGPGNYNPLEEDNFQGFKGRSLVRLEPLGRLKETLPLTRAQSLAIADQVRLRIVQAGRFRSQVEFTDFVSRLPAWEDVNGDLVLDGAPYTVTTNGAPDYTRRVYWREDWNSSGTMDRQVFTVASG